MALEVVTGRVGRVASAGVRQAPRARYLPIAEHGLIGDLHTAALVGTDGTIDWYCCPRFDSPSVFADDPRCQPLRPAPHHTRLRRLARIGWVALAGSSRRSRGGVR